jgi:hypothetical protein
MITYEERLGSNLSWGFMVGSLHFENDSFVHKSLRAIASRLDEMAIPYAVVGGMALFFHGVRRFTDDIDISVSKENLAIIHARLEGLGYLLPFAGSKELRDTDTGVRIEFVTTGDYPGDGLPSPVAFPEPAAVNVEIDGICCLQVIPLIEMKLASGMASTRRLRDLADVVRLIETLGLPEDLAARLNPHVQQKYREIWTAVHSNPP